MKRNFVYSTDGFPTASHSPPLKKQKSFAENKYLIDDDDLLDEIGTQALEQFESNNHLAFPDKIDGQCVSITTSTSPNLPNPSSSSANGYQPRIIPYCQGNSEITENLHLKIKELEQKIKLLQDEKYSQVGEVKILREKLNQAETNTHNKKMNLQQINDQKLAEKEAEWAEKEKKFEEHIASLSSRLKFKEQEASVAAFEKCKCSEHHNKVGQKEILPLTEEMRVQSDIKMTPVISRCRDTKNAHRSFKNFTTEFPTSDPLKAFSQQDGCCNKGKMKARVPQQRYNRAVNSTSTPMHSTPVVDQGTQTPVDVLQHGSRNEDGIRCMELGDPSMSMSGRKLFNHLMGIHPWLSHSCKDSIMSMNGGLLTSTHDKDREVSMEDDKGEDRMNYFISLELPTSTGSSPFLRDSIVQHDLRQSLANMLGSPYLPLVYPEQHLLSDLDSVGIARGDSGITLLLVLEKLVRKYCLERSKGQDGHCKSVESWVSGSLEGLLPPFASLLDDDRVGHAPRDPMRMDNVQAIVCIMEVLLDLVCHSKPVRSYILDNCLGIPSKPPLALSSHCVSLDRKWGDVSSNGRITPCVVEQVDNDGVVTMECDDEMVKTQAPDISCLKHLEMLPLTTKLGAPQRINCMAEVSVSMSKKVLTEASLDASILSSVIGSYDDHNLLGSASFMYQGSSDYSNSSLHLCNLFNTLLRLMEPSHRCYEEEGAMMSNALDILVVLAQDCSEHQMECYLEPMLGTILRCMLRRGQARMCVAVIELLYHLASSQAVISNICNSSDNCPLLQAYELLTNPPKPSTDVDTEYGLKILQMVARSVCTGNKDGGKPMFIFDFDCCCSSELISGLLAFTNRMIKKFMSGSGPTSNISYEVISQVTLVLLPVIVNQDIGDDITHSDIYKHDYTEVVKGLSTVLLQSASSCGKWEQAVSTLKELLDYDDLQDCFNSSCNSATTKNMITD